MSGFGPFRTFWSSPTMAAPSKIGVLSGCNRRLPGRPTPAWLRRALGIGVRQAHGRKARGPRSARLPRPVLARDRAGPAPLPCLEAHRIIAIEPLSRGWSGCKHDDRSHEEKRAHHQPSWHEADQSERVRRRGHVYARLIRRRSGFRYPRRQVTLSCSTESRRSQLASAAHESEIGARLLHRMLAEVASHGRKIFRFRKLLKYLMHQFIVIGGNHCDGVPQVSKLTPGKSRLRCCHQSPEYRAP